MNQIKQVNPQETERLMGTLWHPSIRDDPYKFVMFSYPWGEPNKPLAQVEGPRVWQKDELNRITDHIGRNKLLMQKGDPPEVYKLAVCSGRGIGKSAFIAWISHWMMSCVLGSTTMITANTASQLSNKTFAEIGKWLTMFVAGYWFDRNQTKIIPHPWFANAIRSRQIDAQYYYVDGALWNEDNPDAFAGAHNPNGFCLMYDEASGIPKPIWTVSSGFFTDISAYRLWLVFSNGRSNTGPFYECFNSGRNFWYNRQIDSRTVEGLDQHAFEQIIAEHGEDSDEAAVEVKGGFPSQGENQFIPRGVVQGAQRRALENYDDHAALVIGVDPARYGKDRTAITFRRGRDARSIPAVFIKGLDNMKVANRLAELIDDHDPDAVFIDAGAGAGVIDRLKERGYQRIFEVGFGTVSENNKYYDHRTELWNSMREWLAGGMIVNDTSEEGRRLETDLCGPRYGFFGREEKIKLESKEDMKTRHLDSPDSADSLALTFHKKVLRRSRPGERPGTRVPRQARRYRGSDYKVFG